MGETVALSTLWNAPRHDNGQAMVAEMKALGFTSIELNYKITESMMWDVVSMVGEGQIEVCSLHNFTPLPRHLGREMAAGDLFMLSAPDKVEREVAVQYTKRTIDFARRLEAEVIVMHLGSAVAEITPFKKHERQLSSILRSGRYDPLEIQTLRLKLQKMRKEEEKDRFQATLRSLEELAEYAHNKGVKLGVENRFYHFQIPNFEEMGEIFHRFPGDPIYYWHDVGHAQTIEFLGFGEHEAFLREFEQRMLGIHLHDCQKGEDHLAPGMGEIDFGVIASYLSPEMIKVLEPKDTVTSEQILNGLKFLNNYGIG